MQQQTLAELLSFLKPDSWREANGFSLDIAPVNEALWAAQSVPEAELLLRQWLSAHQPCLFGRVAAKENAITFCILTETDIVEHDDLWVREYIQKSRLAWLRAGFEGHSSGFVIAVISRAVAHAQPGSGALEFSRKLYSLYLLREDIGIDTIYHDEIFLSSGRDRMWKWLAGVNYFSAAGDGRWWHDHRFPGGMAISVNSVGHLVKSGRLSRAEAEYRRNLDIQEDDDGEPNPHVDSLEKALVWAMRTIQMAADGVSGRATHLALR